MYFFSQQYLNSSFLSPGQFLREKEDGIRISLQELSKQHFNEDEVIAELQSVISDFSKSRQAIPQAVELIDLRELNRQAVERVRSSHSSQQTQNSPHRHDAIMTGGAVNTSPDPSVESWV